jgi:hypothetical protein
LVCFWNPEVVSVFEDLVGVPDFEPLVTVEVALGAVEAAVEVVEEVRCC